VKTVQLSALWALGLLIVLSASPSVAGSTQYNQQLFHEPDKIIRFAKKVEKTLAEHGARVALVARVGRPRDKLPQAVLYTHVGIAIYSHITTEDGRKIPGYAFYNLYQRPDKPDRSELVQDFAVDFFSGAQLLEAGVILLNPELQKRVLDLVREQGLEKLHVEEYSAIANPFTSQYQNCTEHTLDVIIAALYQTTDVPTIKDRIRSYFVAQPLEISPFTLFAGSVFTSEIAASDHSGPPATATFSTIADFLLKYQLADTVLAVTLDT
jgi:hypothetical protein